MREEFLGRLSLPRVNGLAAAILFLSTGIGEATQRAPQTINFSRDIYPIFERSCHSCHGPEQQQGKLRLDSRQAALRGGQSGKIVRPGNSAESSLYQRVAGLNDLVRMPMGGELAADEIGLIRNWIDEGAEWPEAAGLAEGETPGQHWAFVAPKRPSLPQVRNEAWPANAIDYFILTRLEQEKLSPSPEADRIVLLRRLSLDLVGLPPSIEEVETFLADRRPDAYERQVERLLASPHYGERWGRHWLDAARYADSDGFEKDKPRRVWFYRDWVINALNRDLPYDDFIIQQLAGDLLPDAGQDQIVATGFLRNSMINAEGGIDPEQFRMEALFDRMDAIGKGILGITIQCAQCHDHKYDPLKQEEYYRLFAFLNNTHEANLAVYTPAEQMKRSEVFRRIREVEANLKHTHPDWKQKIACWEDRVRDEQPNWTVLRPTVEDISSGGQKYLPQADGSFLAQGYAPTKHRVKMTVETELRSLTAFRLELMNDPNLPLGGPGRSLKGTGALTEFEVEAGATGSPEQLEKVEIAGATADIALPESPLEAMFDDKSDQLRVTGPIEFAIDGDEKTAWGIDAGPGRRNLPRKAVFTAKTPITHPQGTLLRFHLSQSHGGANSDDNQNHNLGRFRISTTTSPGATVDPLPAGLRETLEIPRLDRTPSQTQAVFSYWRTTVPEWGQANQSIEELWRQHPEGTAQLVLEERARRRETHLLNRGDFLSPGRPVSSGVPAFLHPFPQDAPPNRLGFARWLVDSGSPTTARSLVNRVWQAYFGIGLVASSENLGRQSEAPSHPRLLDWLAVEFMEQGWSLKQLHRLIVSSATYRQSSKQTRELRPGSGSQAAWDAGGYPGPMGRGIRTDSHELRALQIFTAWMNHNDSDSVNTLDMYFTDAEGRGYVRHHLIDFGTVFGSGAHQPHARRVGNEYYIEFKPALKAAGTLGIWDRPWRKLKFQEYKSIGRFESDYFQPQHWRPDYPNPAFDKMTLQDALWATRTVMRFSDEAIRAMVAIGKIDEAAAADYLTRVLIERRDKIVRYYLGQINPIDGFTVADGEKEKTLEFTNLGLKAGLSARCEYSYQWSQFDNQTETSSPLGSSVARTGVENISIPEDPGEFLLLQVRSECSDQPNWRSEVRIYLRNGPTLEVVGIERDDPPGAGS